jgi:hypothetical protein
MARYEAGETLASIARSYDCSPPAISYIVSRSRARGVAPNAVGSRAVSSETQLIKSQGVEALAGESGVPGAASTLVGELGLTDLSEVGPGVAVPPVLGIPRGQVIISDTTSLGGSKRLDEHAHSEREDVSEGKNGRDARSSEPIDEPMQDRRPQRTLHLSPHREDAVAPEPYHHESRGGSLSGSHTGPDPGPDDRDRGRSDRDEVGRPPPLGNGSQARFAHEPRSGEEGSIFIDNALRQRVQGDIAAFLAAFDAALNRDTSETRDELRRATDRLLRAGARTRIELERLEARVPLPLRNNERPADTTWRQR